MLKALLWIKRAFEGYDGNASHQKLLVGYMTVLFTFVVLSVGVMNYEYPDGIYHIMAGTILGQSAIRAWQTTKNNKINKEDDNDNKKLSE